MNSKEKSMGFFTRKEKTIFSKAQKEELKTLRARVKVLEESYERNRSNDIKKELDDLSMEKVGKMAKKKAKEIEKSMNDIDTRHRVIARLASKFRK